MNQKNHKEIAGIIKQHRGSYLGTEFVIDLANYFETERGQMVKTFNKKQFLKDCGLI